MTAFRTLASLAFVLAFTGCNAEGPGFDSYFGGEDNMSARMTGEMPEVGTFDDDSKHGYLHTDGQYLDLQVHAVGDYGWAMLMVFAELDEDGEVIEGTDEVIGCSGPEENQADFDEPASDSDMDIEKIEVDGEEMYEITINATFDDQGTVLATGQATAGQDWY